MKLSKEIRRQLGGMLLRHIRATYKTQSAAAIAWGVQRPWVSRIVSGHKPPTDAMLAEAGIELMAVYKTPNKYE